MRKAREHISAPLQAYNGGMLRPLLLAIVAGLLLCAICVTPPQPAVACASDGHTSNPKQPQLDVLPAPSNPNAIKLQPAHVPWSGIQISSFEIEERAVRVSRLASLSIFDSVRASTVLRI